MAPANLDHVDMSGTGIQCMAVGALETLIFRALLCEPTIALVWSDESLRYLLHEKRPRKGQCQHKELPGLRVSFSPCAPILRIEYSDLGFSQAKRMCLLKWYPGLCWPPHHLEAHSHSRIVMKGTVSRADCQSLNLNSATYDMTLGKLLVSLSLI